MGRAYESKQRADYGGNLSDDDRDLSFDGHPMIVTTPIVKKGRYLYKCEQLSCNVARCGACGRGRIWWDATSCKVCKAVVIKSSRLLR